MNILRKIVVAISGMCLAIVLGVLVLIHGWGLEPKSWWWIIGVGFFGQVMAQAIIKIGLSDE